MSATDWGEGNTFQNFGEFLQATVLAHKRFGRHVLYDVRLER